MSDFSMVSTSLSYINNNFVIVLTAEVGLHAVMQFSIVEINNSVEVCAECAVVSEIIFDQQLTAVQKRVTTVL